MKKWPKIFVAVLTTVFLLGTGTSAFAAVVEKVNMALLPETQQLYLCVKTTCDFEGYFKMEPESLVVAPYDSTIDCGDYCTPDFTCMVNCTLQVKPGLTPGQLVTFKARIYENANPGVPIDSVDDVLQVKEGSMLGDDYFGYLWDCDPYVPDSVSTDPLYDFCLWLCHRTYSIPIICHEPLQGIPMFRIRPDCDHDLEIDPEHLYSKCSYDTCGSIADELALSWFVVIPDTDECIAFLIILYGQADSGCACLKAPDWILPVELTAFNANAGDGYVDLTWTTASELNNDHFYIWRRSDGQNWMAIARIPGHGTTSDMQHYTYRDASVENGITYEYMLKSEDINGERHTYDYFVTATPRSVEVPATYELRQNYPNPFNTSTAFEFTLPESGPVSLKIHDLLGREVATVVEGNLEARRHHVTWSAAGLPSGIYLYTLNAGEFTQTRKMLFLK